MHVSQTCIENAIFFTHQPRKHYNKQRWLTEVLVYAKLFTSIYQGTLRGNSHGLLVFTNLLAHCDKNGAADIHPRAIAEEVGLTVDQVNAALRVLESPDDESRSPEEQGRRIVRLDEHRAWGWLVVNYCKYRAIRDEDDRREQNRLSQERWRNKHKPPSAQISSVSQSKPQSAHTEAEAEADTERGSSRVRGARASRLPTDWTLPDDWAQWAKTERPDLDPAKTAESFADYWHAKAGKTATKADWKATWRLWVRNQRAGPVARSSASAAPSWVEDRDKRVASFAGRFAESRKSTVNMGEVIDVTPPKLD
jgi:hypothetical protein